MEPRVVASPDGAHLAVLRDHRLSLFALDTGRRLAVADVPGTALAFAGAHVVVHGRDPRISVITVLSMPTLAVTSSHELTAPTRLMAAANGFVLLDRGDQALMIQCGRAAAVSPLRPPAAFAHAVGLEEPQFITFGSRGAELWDAASRRPEARLRLELPAETVEVGLTNRHTLLWAATSEPCLHLARISDGRLSTLWLDATPRNLRSHPVAAWVVADVGGRALALNLAIGDIVPLDSNGGSIVAVAPRRDRDAGAVVVLLDGDALELRLLGGEARPIRRRDVDDPLEGEPEAPHAAPSDVAVGVAAPGEAGGSGARPSTLRERLGQRPQTLDRVIPPPTVIGAAAPVPPADEPSARRPASNLAERLGGRSSTRSIGAPTGVGVEERASAGPAPVVDAAALAPLVPEPMPPAPPPAVAPPVVARAVAPSSPAPAPPALRRHAASEPTGQPGGNTWRDALVAWTRAGVGEPPALAGTALRALHVHHGLAPSAWPMLCALYGGWLLGRGARGLATARLAALAGDEAGLGWAEALGTTSLGDLGLITWRHGRACLAVALGDYLDERPPAIAELIGVARRRPAPLGQGTLVGEGAAAARGHAVRIADELGQVALFTGAVGGADLAQARLEAWLRGLALVVVGDPGPLALRLEESVVAVVPRSA